MIFSSLEFLFLYLPAVIAVYYLTPAKFKNISLLLFSFVFFGWSAPEFLIFLIFTITANYAFGLLIFQSKEKGKFKTAKVLTAAAVILNLSFWAFFRYAGLYPLGIAFYSLQCISYILDIYQKNAEAQKNIVSLGVYISAFFKITAGPVCKYCDAKAQISHRKESVSMFARGIRTFICGICKKVLFADAAASVFSYIKALPESDITVAGAWFGLIAFGLYVYFEFSGYCDMAIGLGRIFGFDLPENFNYPFVSKSVSEFFEKWHMSLIGWFLEYLSFPLKKNKYLNIAAVSVLIGLWHGANWNYIILGLYFGIILTLEKRFVLNILKKAPAFIGRIYLWILTLFGFLIFAFEDMRKGFSYLGKLFGFSVKGFLDGGAIYDIMRYLPFLILAVIGCTPLPKSLFYKFSQKSNKSGQIANMAFSVISAALFLICAAFLIDSGSVSFLYFRF